MARGPRHLGILEQLIDRPAGILAGTNDGQGADFLAHRPQDQRRCFTFLHQAVQAPVKRPRSRESSFAQTLEVVAGNVDHGIADLFQAQLPGRVQQAELHDFLVRGEQVAFDAVGEEGQGALTGLAGFDLLALGGQALGDPAGATARARSDRSAGSGPCHRGR